MNRALVATLATALLLAAAAPAVAGMHKDERLGFQIIYPNGWSQIPVGINERWIVAKFLSDKIYREMDDDGWPIEFKPDMRVIIFPFEITKRRGPRKEEVEVPGGSGSVTVYDFENPYKDYKDYLKQTYSGGGWFISKEEEKSEKNLNWTLWEIKVEKLARNGTKRIVAGIFHAGDADFVVQFEVLEGDYKKLRGMIYGSLNSFKFIERTGSLTEGRKGRVTFEDEDELTPKERQKRRRAKVEQAFERAKEQLPKDWSSFEYKGKFLVLTHVDKKTSVELLYPGLGVWQWLDKEFDFLGDEYVRPLIVRICKDSEEASAYQDSSGGITFFSSTFTEVVLYEKDKSTFGGFFISFGGLPGRVMSNWFHDKDRDLYWEFPSWLSSGLNDLFGSAQVKGSRLTFPPDGWDVRDIKIAAARGELRPVKDLITSGWSGKHFSAEAAAFVRFLILGPGRRMKLTKNFLETYMGALKEKALEEEKKREEEIEKMDPEDRPKTEEEEEEEFRKRRQRGSNDEWEKREKELLKSILERAFPDWTDKDWETVDRAYRVTITR